MPKYLLKASYNAEGVRGVMKEGGTKPEAAARRPFVVKARPLRLRAGIHPAGLNKLADELEAESFVEQHQRGRRA